MTNNITNVTVNNGEKKQLNDDAGSKIILWVFGLLLLVHVIWPGFLEALGLN